MEDPAYQEPRAEQQSSTRSWFQPEVYASGMLLTGRLDVTGVVCGQKNGFLKKLLNFSGMIAQFLDDLSCVLPEDRWGKPHGSRGIRELQWTSRHIDSLYP